MFFLDLFNYLRKLLFLNEKYVKLQLFPAHEAGVRMIALRCAGFDRVDLKAAEQHGITVARVPAYSSLSANCIQQKLETEPSKKNEQNTTKQKRFCKVLR